MSRPRILVITPELPYPALFGRDLRNWQNIRALAQLGEVGVYSDLAREPSAVTIPPLKLAFWRASGDSATGAPPRRNNLAAQTALRDPQPNPADSSCTKSGIGEIVEILNAFRPDWVVVEGLSLFRYIDIAKRHASSHVVLDCHNVEAVLCEQISNIERADTVPQRLDRELLPVRAKIIEERALQTVDQVWVCSEPDRQKMRLLYPNAKPIYIVPNTIDVERYAAVRRDRSQNKTLVFPAQFGYPPNIEGARFSISELLPRLTPIVDDWQMIFAGLHPTAEMTQAAQRDSRIVVTGAVPDMRPYLASASAMIVPLFQGSGTRFKILEAFAAKLPVISTPLGIEGLAVQHEKHILLAETAEEFVEAITRLWNDTPLVRSLGENGLAMVSQSYSHEVAAQRIAAALKSLQ